MKAIALVPFLVALACQSKAQDKSAPAAGAEAKEVEAVAKAKAATPAAAAELPTALAKAEQDLPKTGLELDLDRLCNAEELSGALDLPTGDRALHTGIWLAKNIETQEVRDFVAELTRLGPDDRIARLQAKLGEHEITSCEIVHAWSGKS